MSKLLSQVISASLGLWLASLFVSGVIIRTYPDSHFFNFKVLWQWQIILILGITIGILNYFLKLMLKSLDLPIEIISLELFIIVIDMVFLWILDLIFNELTVPIINPLFYTVLIIWGINLILNLSFKKNKK